MAPRTLHRRELLRDAGVGTGALILGGVVVDPLAAAKPRRRPKVPFARNGSFGQGVSSAIPGTKVATMWTRLGDVRGNRRLRLEIARDPEFRNVVHRRIVTARADRDHTVEARVGGKFLKPGREYFYRFETRNAESAVGRFRTRVPLDSREPVRIAVFSCQEWQPGFFNAQRAIAGEDVDFVLCLGDYIYEGNFSEGPRRDTLGANGDGEVQTLPEYRSKYQLYKGDADLQAMHAAHPYAVIWDDHDVEDNYAGALPGEKTKQVRVPFLARRANGYRSFYEYHPISPIAGRPEQGNDLYRKLRVGANVELFLLDSRQYRADQPCGDSATAPCPTAERDYRPYLGADQLRWLQRGLEGSGASWKLIGNQLMIMGLDVQREVLALNKDSWDGYGVERRRLLEFVRSKGIRDVSFLTGDIHTFFAGEVGTDGRGPESVATEFVCGSATSPGLESEVGDRSGEVLPPELAFLVTERVRVQNPHIKFDDQRRRGYAILEAQPDELRVAFRAVDALRKGAAARTLAAFSVARGSPRVRTL